MERNMLFVVLCLFAINAQYRQINAFPHDGGSEVEKAVGPIGVSDTGSAAVAKTASSISNGGCYSGAAAESAAHAAAEASESKINSATISTAESVAGSHTKEIGAKNRVSASSALAKAKSGSYRSDSMIKPVSYWYDYNHPYLYDHEANWYGYNPDVRYSNSATHAIAATKSKGGEESYAYGEAKAVGTAESTSGIGSHVNAATKTTSGAKTYDTNINNANSVAGPIANANANSFNVYSNTKGKYAEPNYWYGYKRNWNDYKLHRPDYGYENEYGGIGYGHNRKNFLHNVLGHGARHGKKYDVGHDYIYSAAIANAQSESKLKALHGYKPIWNVYEPHSDNNLENWLNYRYGKGYGRTGYRHYNDEFWHDARHDAKYGFPRGYTAANSATVANTRIGSDSNVLTTTKYASENIASKENAADPSVAPEFASVKKANGESAASVVSSTETEATQASSGVATSVNTVTSSNTEDSSVANIASASESHAGVVKDSASSTLAETGSEAVASLSTLN